MFSRAKLLTRRYRLSPMDRQVAKVQLLVLLTLCLLLGAAHMVQQQWRAFADQYRLHLILRGWDGFAWFAWLAVAPLMLVLIRRYPLTRGRLIRSLVGLVGESLLIYFIVINVRFGLRVLPNLWRPLPEMLPADWAAFFDTNLYLLPIDLLTYSGFFVISFAVDHFYQARRAADEAINLQLRTSRLETDLSHAELAMLRNQLHPHFLFNSFNAVASLVRQKKNEAAVEIIAQLSTLLRRALERTGCPTVLLEDEMDFVRQYLEVEKVRFGEKLQVRFFLDPASLGALVPNLVLQPLVENAVKHGISQRVEPGIISIRTERRGGRLMLEIANDGPDHSLPSNDGTTAKSTGIGLANTRLRLEKLYGSDYFFDLAAREEGGMCVRLNLPWQQAAVESVVVIP